MNLPLANFSFWNLNVQIYKAYRCCHTVSGLHTDIAGQFRHFSSCVRALGDTVLAGTKFRWQWTILDCQKTCSALSRCLFVAPDFVFSKQFITKLILDVYMSSLACGASIGHVSNFSSQWAVDWKLWRAQCMMNSGMTNHCKIQHAVHLRQFWLCGQTLAGIRICLILNTMSD
jgi:hypothetical protein